jgi:DNA polymerase III subunit beta
VKVPIGNKEIIMKTITLNTAGLLNSVAVANTFMPKEGDFVGKIVLVGTNGKLEVKATDMIQTVIFKDISFVSSDLTDDNFSAFSVDGKKFLTVLKAAKTDEVQVELQPEQIMVKSGRSKVKIEIMANTQSIEISTNGNSFDFSNQIGQMEQVLHAIGSNEAKFELNGALLQVKNGVFNIVGTDTKRLASITTETDLSDTEVIVPKQGIQTIVKLFKGFNISAEIDDVNLSVHTTSVSYSTRLINGKYPDWKRIVPQSLIQTITISRFGLETMIKEASIFDSSITIRIQNGVIKITDFEGNTEVVDSFTDKNANVVFAVDSKYILEFLASFNEDNVQIGFNGSNLPIMLIANPSYKEITMPIVMQEKEEISDVEDFQNAA